MEDSSFVVNHVNKYPCICCNALKHARMMRKESLIEGLLDKSGIGDFELTLKFDPEKKGLAKVLRDYQQEALKSIWKNGEKGQTSSQTHEYVNGKIEGSISRASIINFLKVMADEGVLDYEMHPGKGGMRPIYTPRMNESEFKIHVAQTIIASLVKDFPEETKIAFSQLSM